MVGKPLGKCPTCLTPVNEATLGFRDYRFLGSVLPGKVAPMDFDMVLERKGHVLIVELKPKGVTIGRGQQLTYKTMVGMGCDVWLVQGDDKDDTVAMASMDVHGVWKNRRSVKPEKFVEAVGEWWDAHA